MAKTIGDLSKIILTIAEFHPDDQVRKVGGFHTLNQINSEVDDVFQPGWQAPSDFPTDTFDQYRKVFWRNETGGSLFGCKFYGFNVKGSGIVKMALEKGPGELAIINGSEAVKNYQTRPALFVEYQFTELQFADAQLGGNFGLLRRSEGQGIWLRQRIATGTVLDPSDEFTLGIRFLDDELDGFTPLLTSEGIPIVNEDDDVILVAE